MFGAILAGIGHSQANYERQKQVDLLDWQKDTYERLWKEADILMSSGDADHQDRGKKLKKLLMDDGPRAIKKVIAAYPDLVQSGEDYHALKEQKRMQDKQRRPQVKQGGSMVNPALTDPVMQEKPQQFSIGDLIQGSIFDPMRGRAIGGGAQTPPFPQTSSPSSTGANFTELPKPDNIDLPSMVIDKWGNINKSALNAAIQSEAGPEPQQPNIEYDAWGNVAKSYEVKYNQWVKAHDQWNKKVDDVRQVYLDKASEEKTIRGVAGDDENIRMQLGDRADPRYNYTVRMRNGVIVGAMKEGKRLSSIEQQEMDSWIAQDPKRRTASDWYDKKQKDAERKQNNRGVNMLIPSKDGKSYTVAQFKAGDYVPPGSVTPAGATRLNIPTESIRTMAAKAPRVINFVNRIEEIINANEQAIGPLEGRWNEFKTGKVGLKGKDGFVAIRTNLGLLSTALMQMHVGARGGERIMQHFVDLIGNVEQDPENIKAALEELKAYAEDVASEGQNLAYQDQMTPRTTTPRVNPSQGSQTQGNQGVKKGIPPPPKW